MYNQSITLLLLPAAPCVVTARPLRRYQIRGAPCVDQQIPFGSVSYVAMLDVAAMLGVMLTGEWHVEMPAKELQSNFILQACVC